MALHPDDLLRPGLREAALRGIDAALDAGAHTVTYESLLSFGLGKAPVGDFHRSYDRDPGRSDAGRLRYPSHLR
jgi:hypothetical protein